MNKKFLIYALVFVGITAATFASAATFSMSPANISVTEGQNFSVNILVDSQNSASYTGKLEFKYSPALLEVKSFSFGDNWMPISQPGYDLIDNAGGILIKTGGYPGGFNSKTLFGTITFRAKKVSDGIMQITTDSMALDSESKNIVSGLPISALVSIVKRSPVVVLKTPESDIASDTAPNQEQKEMVAVTDQALPPEAVAENKSLLSATIVNLNITFGGLLVVLVAFLIGFFIYMRFKRKS